MLRNTNYGRIGWVAVILFALSAFLFQACQKSEQEVISIAGANVKVQLSAGVSDEIDVKVASAARPNVKKTISSVQHSSIAIDEGTTLEVTMSKEAGDYSNVSNATSNGSALRAAASLTTLKPLDIGVKYRVAVYTQAGEFVESHDYVYGSEASTPGFPLNAGQTYTFIVYSVNSKTMLPEIENKDNLSTASLRDITEDLMYFKKSLKLVYGENLLAAVLEHQFSQITTVIQMEDSMAGSIEQLSGVGFQTSKVSASLKFSDNSMSYADNLAAGTVSFPGYSPSAQLREVISTPTLLISPKTEQASLKIGNITMDGDAKSNLVIDNIKIEPGHRYRLVLKFKACALDVESNEMNWRYPEVTKGNRTGIEKDGKFYRNNEVIENTFSAPGADRGFVFNITELDNAFNMRVNGQFIFGSSANDQIQFETTSNLGINRNIQFIDGSEHAVNGIPQIYNMKATSVNTPLLRVIISRNGEVTILGSKINNSPLMQMKLKGGKSFNKVIWNSTGNNTVIVSQKVAGRTFVVGTGSGKKFIKCN